MKIRNLQSPELKYGLKSLSIGQFPQLLLLLKEHIDMGSRLFVLSLVLLSPCVGQTVEQKTALPSSATVNCSQQLLAGQSASKTNVGFKNLTEATALVVNAINVARCNNYDPQGRFQLTTADMDFQTVVDKDGTLEIIFIGGAAGELDKQVTTDADFTYSVPTPVGATPLSHADMIVLVNKPKTKVTPAKTLGEAIAAAMQQMAAGVGDLPNLSQHQVKVSIKFAFTKDGTLELEATYQKVGITAKYKVTHTSTHTLTLTFADLVPTVNLTATPPSPISEGVSVTLIASVIPPANSAVPPQGGNVTFLDGNVSLGVQQLKNGFAGIIIPSLAPGVHSLTAAYGSDSHYDSAASTATIMVVGPNIIQH